MKKIESKNVKQLEGKTESGFALSKKSIGLIIIGFAVMVIGFVLLGGGGSSDPNVFSPAIFSARRLVVAPIVIILGIIVIIAAIMRKERQKD